MICTICRAPLDPTEHGTPDHKGPQLCSDDCCETMIRRFWGQWGLAPDIARASGVEDGRRESRVRLVALEGVMVGAVWAGRP